MSSEYNCCLGYRHRYDSRRGMFLGGASITNHVKLAHVTVAHVRVAIGNVVCVKVEPIKVVRVGVSQLNVTRVGDAPVRVEQVGGAPVGSRRTSAQLIVAWLG